MQTEWIKLVAEKRMDEWKLEGDVEKNIGVCPLCFQTCDAGRKEYK